MLTPTEMVIVAKTTHGDKTFRLIPVVQEVYRALHYVWDNRDPLSRFVFTNLKTGREYNYRSKFLGTI